MTLLTNFCLLTGNSQNEIFLKTPTGLVPAVDQDLTNSDVVDFYDRAGKHVGYVDGSHFEGRCVEAPKPSLRTRLIATFFSKHFSEMLRRSLQTTV